MDEETTRCGGFIFATARNRPPPRPELYPNLSYQLDQIFLVSLEDMEKLVYENQLGFIFWEPCMCVCVCVDLCCLYQVLSVYEAKSISKSYFIFRVNILYI